MAKRKQRVARRKTTSKRGKARTRAKSALGKTAKRAKARAKKATTRVVETKAKKKAVKPRAKRAAPRKAAPRPTEPPRQAAEALDETVIVDIIEEPVPGVMVVTEFESVRTSRPATPTPRPKGGEGSGED